MKSVIAINGIMGAGKSTIGKKLATELNYYFIDIDNEIEDRSKKTINEIFAQKGEEFFRGQEFELISEMLRRREKMVMALGGGAYTNIKVRKLLGNHAITVWLRAEVDDIYKRVKDKTNRPLLNKGNKKKILEDLIALRQPIYQKSDMIIDIKGKDSKQLVEEIMQNLNSKKDE